MLYACINGWDCAVLCLTCSSTIEKGASDTRHGLTLAETYLRGTAAVPTSPIAVNAAPAMKVA